MFSEPKTEGLAMDTPKHGTDGTGFDSRRDGIVRALRQLAAEVEGTPEAVVASRAVLIAPAVEVLVKTVRRALARG